MTLLDIIETYNIMHDKPLDDMGSIYADIDIDERLDKDILIGALLDQCGAMRVIYETTPTFKYFSDNFFKKYKWNIGKLMDTLELRYDPLINKKLNWTETTDIEQNLDTEEEKSENRSKDNTGTQTTDNTGTQTTNDTGTQTKADTGTQTTADTGTQTRKDTGTQVTEDTGTQENEYEDHQENTISAMNADTYQPDNKKDTTGSNTRTDNLQSERTDNLQSQRTDNLQSQRTDNLQSQRTDNLQSQRTDNLQNLRTDNLNETIEASTARDKSEQLVWDETDTHTESGMTGDAQSLIEKERKIAQFSIYNWITKKYANELFLLVY